MSDTISTGTEVGPAEAQQISAKILQFPTPVVAAQAATAPGGSIATVPSAFQRLTAVRRRRGDRTAERAAFTEQPASAVGTRPSISQLVTWLLNLRKGGVGFLYWNAAKLPIEVALIRAARLDEGAIVDVVGHKLLVVEPLRPRLATPGEVLP